MSDVINLVQGDTGPQIKATLTRADTGDAIDLSEATTRLHFRKANTSTNLFSLTNSAGTSDKESGICIFVFSGSNLDLSAGDYQGEIEVVFSDSTRETVYELIEFNIREDIA